LLALQLKLYKSTVESTIKLLNCAFCIAFVLFIQLMPRVSSLPGFLIEVKAAKHYSLDKLEELSQIALEQITKQKYDTDMRAKGVSKVFKFGIAFSGKDVKIAVS